MFTECFIITVAYIALNGKDGAFSYFHGHTNWVNIYEMFKENGPSILFLLDGEFPLGHSASRARTAIPSEKKKKKKKQPAHF